MFDNVLFLPFVDGTVKAKPSVRLHIVDTVVLHVVVKGGEFDFIGRRRKKNWMMLCESHQ